MKIRRAEDIAPAFEGLRDRAGALYVYQDLLMIANRTRISILTVGARLPSIHGSREDVEGGGLMSYGPNLPDLFRRGAAYGHKILQGTRPADLPVELPVKFDFSINLKTAKALGLTVPESFILRADEVVE